MHQIIDDSKNKKNRFVILEQTLLELDKYMILHLEYEEKLLNEVSYPDIIHHKELHDSFKEKLTEMKKTFYSGEYIMVTEIVIFINEWFLKHIAQEDKKYEPYL